MRRSPAQLLTQVETELTTQTGKAVQGPVQRSMWPRRRAKWDRQPTQSSAVLIAHSMVSLGDGVREEARAERSCACAAVNAP